MKYNDAAITFLNDRLDHAPELPGTPRAPEKDYASTPVAATNQLITCYYEFPPQKDCVRCRGGFFEAASFVPRASVMESIFVDHSSFKEDKSDLVS